MRPLLVLPGLGGNAQALGVANYLHRARLFIGLPRLEPQVQSTAFHVFRTQRSQHLTIVLRIDGLIGPLPHRPITHVSDTPRQDGKTNDGRLSSGDGDAFSLEYQMA